MGGSVGRLTFPNQPNDWAEEFIRKKVKQAAKKAVDKVHNTFDVFGGFGELSSDSTLLAVVIFIGFGLARYLVSLGPASSSSMTTSSGRTSSLALEVEDSWSNSGGDNRTFSHILDGGENSPSSRFIPSLADGLNHN